MATKIEDFYDDGEMFEADLIEAEEKADSVADVSFITNLRTAWTGYGMRAHLSDAQYKWFSRLAGIGDQDDD